MKIPLWVLVAMLVGIPAICAALFGWAAWRKMTPLAFRCRRCGAEFQQAPHLDFPSACPMCQAEDWNAG